MGSTYCRRARMASRRTTSREFAFVIVAAGLWLAACGSRPGASVGKTGLALNGTSDVLDGFSGVGLLTTSQGNQCSAVSICWQGVEERHLAVHFTVCHNGGGRQSSACGSSSGEHLRTSKRGSVRSRTQHSNGKAGAAKRRTSVVNLRRHGRSARVCDLA